MLELTKSKGDKAPCATLWEKEL